MARDLTNQRFGKLTVLYFDDYNSTNHPYWYVRCDCGIEFPVREDSLISGRKTHCGCEKGHPGFNLDLVGRVFDRLTVIKLDHYDIDNRRHWRCLCSCGNMTTVRGIELLSGETRSCGCLRLEKARQSNLIHGLSNTKIASIWNSMKYKCDYGTSKAYDNYGGIGITYCDEWMDLKVFKEWADSNGYKEGMSLDLINPFGDFTPTNCRWVDSIFPIVNRRNEMISIFTDSFYDTIRENELDNAAGIEEYFRFVYTPQYFRDNIFKDLKFDLSNPKDSKKFEDFCRNYSFAQIVIWDTYLELYKRGVEECIDVLEYLDVATQNRMIAVYNKLVLKKLPYPSENYSKFLEELTDCLIAKGYIPSEEPEVAVSSSEEPEEAARSSEEPEEAVSSNEEPLVPKYLVKNKKLLKYLAKNRDGMKPSVKTRRLLKSIVRNRHKESM